MVSIHLAGILNNTFRVNTLFLPRVNICLCHIMLHGTIKIFFFSLLLGYSVPSKTRKLQILMLTAKNPCTFRFLFIYNFYK